MMIKDINGTRKRYIFKIKGSWIFTVGVHIDQYNLKVYTFRCKKFQIEMQIWDVKRLKDKQDK